MSDKKNEEFIQHKLNQVTENLGQKDFLNNYILETLDSFAYRYLSTPHKSELLENEILRVVAVENGIKEAIKLKNPLLRAGIAELVKRVSKEEGPTILREIRVYFIQRTVHSKGQCQVSARISFGHPAHDFSPGTFVEKVSILNFEDELHFRNILAKHLEEVCELF